MVWAQLAISGKVIRAQSASGFSIIEVLVALLVLGVGVMGYAALQLKSVRLSEETYSRSQAMSVAQDFIERVRVNFNEASKARYVAAASWTGEVAESAPVSCVQTQSKPGLDHFCTQAQMADQDIFDARTHVAQVLADGKMQFSQCDNVYCVTVAWADTTVDTCDQADFADGARTANAHCVIVEFIP